MPDVARALQRASFLLRQGEPVNDVAVLLPVDDAWARFEPGKVHLIDELNRQVGTDIPTGILGAGLNFDFVDPMSLTKLGQLERGALRVGAMSYRIVVLPRVERIEPALMKRLDAFARSGGVLIAVGRLPERAPGFLATPADHQAVQALSSALFEGAQPAAHFVRDAGDLAATISRLVAADVGLSPTTPDIGVVHRRSGDIDIYFVANTSNVTSRCRGAIPDATGVSRSGGTTCTARRRRSGWGHATASAPSRCIWRPTSPASSSSRTRLWGQSPLITRGTVPIPSPLFTRGTVPIRLRASR